MNQQEQEVVHEGMVAAMRLLTQAVEAGTGVCLCIGIHRADGEAEKIHILVDEETADVSLATEMGKTELVGKLEAALRPAADTVTPYVEAKKAEMQKLEQELENMNPMEALARLLGMAQDLGSQEDQGLPNDQDNDVPSEFSDFLNSLGR